MPTDKQRMKVQIPQTSQQEQQEALRRYPANRFEDLKNLRHPDNWANILDTYLLQPINGGEGRVLIKVDPYKSRYECTTCHGTGNTGEVCKYCLGTKFEKGKEENGYCRDCTVGTSKTGVGKTHGRVLCPTCKGSGGIIDTPDDTKTKTTMGKVIAVSVDGIKTVKINDSVQFTNYTGTEYEFMGVMLMVCHEKDLLCIVKGLRQDAGNINEVNRAELENTGVPLE